MNIFESQAGYDFVSYTVPELVRQIEILNELIRTQQANLSAQNELIKQLVEALREKTNGR